MRKHIAIFIIASLLLLSSAYAISTSEYESLRAQFEQKEIQYQEYLNNAQFGKALAYNGEMDVLRIELANEKNTVVALYVDLMVEKEHMDILVSDISSTFAGSSILDVMETRLNDFDSKINEADILYNSEEYLAAYNKLQEARRTLAGLSNSAILAAQESISKAQSEIDGTSFLSPSKVAMLDDAKAELEKSKTLFDSCTQYYIADDNQAGNEVCKEAYYTAQSALELSRRALETPDALEDILRILLLVGPVIVVFVLVIFFYRLFNKSTVKVTLSKSKVKAKKKTEVRRTIRLMNLENKPITMTVIDEPPKALKIATPYIEPKSQKGNKLTWDINLRVGETKEIAYTFMIPELDKGWTLKLPAPVVTYTIGATKKKVLGKRQEINIE
jgi:hypothetical protein